MITKEDRFRRDQLEGWFWDETMRSLGIRVTPPPRGWRERLTEEEAALVRLWDNIREQASKEAVQP